VIRNAIVFGILFLGALSAPKDDPEIETITGPELIGHVRYLASDEMKGRGNGSPEMDQAADFLAARLKSYGLAPAFAGDFFQKFEIVIRTDFAPESKVVLRSGATANELALYSGFLPLGLGEETSDIDGELLFAGYGIVTENPPYDDFSGIDASGKILVVMTHSPREKEESKTGEDQLALQSTLTSKAMNARAHGAKGVIIIVDPSHADESEALPPFKEGGTAEEWGLPVVAVHVEAVEPLFQASGRNLAEIHRTIDREMKPQSFAFAGARAEIRLAATRFRKAVRNVGAFLAGETDECIVIGAHYDHLGLGERNSLAPRLAGTPHPGADDNASGVAALLEVAQAFSHEKPQRTIVFAAFAGEELGLLGSSYFVKNPPFLKERLVAMINMDMVGRPRNSKIYVNGVGTSPAFQRIVEEGAKESGLEAVIAKSGYSASDQTAFVAAGIPSLFFFSGLHSDYHKPSDTWDKIDAAASEKVARMVYRVADDVAALPAKPEYVRVEEPAPPAGRSGGMSRGPYFGSIPDFGEDVKGVRFADVRDGSPAAKAGLRADDILIRFGGQEIKNLYDFTFALRAHKPGDSVDVTVLREGKEMTVAVTLEKRE